MKKWIKQLLCFHSYFSSMSVIKALSSLEGGVFVLKIKSCIYCNKVKAEWVSEAVDEGVSK